MNKRPGHVNVTTEVAYCSFCGRPRTLRREEHQLGTLVRTIVTCETCHRTLSSSIGVAPSEPAAAEEPTTTKVESPAAATPAPEGAPAKRAPSAAVARAAAKQPAPKKPAAKATPAKPAPKKPAAKAATSMKSAAAKGSTAKKTASKKK